ncbi:MAG: SDR family oxidoreductase [Balneolaceae bacterium]|nr:SDR family oxidoreductase [Balneolaceae bacterium]
MNSKNKETVLIVGCGWLGKKLGKSLAETGYQVYGTSRSTENFSEIRKYGIHPIQLKLTKKQNEILTELPLADSVVISLSPGRGDDRQYYPQIMSRLAQFLSKTNGQVIMYSSTSAYKNLKKVVREEDATPNRESENVLLAAEGALREHCKDSVIMRLCGLYGKDRHPVKYLAGRSDVSDGEAPVNLVHSTDVVRATQLLIERNIRDEIFNVCGDCHPQKQHIYARIAEQLGLQKPTFKPGGNDSKLIKSEKIKQEGFSFMHPDPLKYEGNPL